MLTCMPTRFLASPGAHLADATSWLESAQHNLDVRRSLLIRTADAPLNGPTELIVIPFRAPSATSTHRKQLSIPILLPR
jgi:hypothetical protein